MREKAIKAGQEWQAFKGGRKVIVSSVKGIWVHYRFTDTDRTAYTHKGSFRGRFDRLPR